MQAFCPSPGSGDPQQRLQDQQTSPWCSAQLPSQPFAGLKGMSWTTACPWRGTAQRDNGPARKHPSQCRATAKKQPCGSALAGGRAAVSTWLLLFPRRDALEIKHWAAGWGWIAPLSRLPCLAGCLLHPTYGHCSRLLEQRSAAALAMSEQAWVWQRPLALPRRGWGGGHLVSGAALGHLRLFCPHRTTAGLGAGA